MVAAKLCNQIHYLDDAHLETELKFEPEQKRRREEKPINEGDMRQQMKPKEV